MTRAARLRIAIAPSAQRIGLVPPTHAQPARADRGLSVRAWITFGTLAVSTVRVLGKARRARRSTDLFDHAEVVVGTAALLLALARVRRGRGHRDDRPLPR